MVFPDTRLDSVSPMRDARTRLCCLLFLNREGNMVALAVLASMAAAGPQWHCESLSSQAQMSRCSAARRSRRTPTERIQQLRDIRGSFGQ
jgi:hypothetical protein